MWVGGVQAVFVAKIKKYLSTLPENSFFLELKFYPKVGSFLLAFELVEMIQMIHYYMETS